MTPTPPWGWGCPAPAVQGSRALGPAIDTTHFNQQEAPGNTLFVFLERVTQETLISFHTIIHHNQKEHSKGNTISQLLITSKVCSTNSIL